MTRVIKRSRVASVIREKRQAQALFAKPLYRTTRELDLAAQAARTKPYDPTPQLRKGASRKP
jgi:hypothetical protein